jgi:antitoxin YefM
MLTVTIDNSNSLDATHHELSSKTNEKRLNAAIEQFRTGQFFTKELTEE